MRAKQAMAMMTTAIILVMIIGCATMGRMTPREEVVAAITGFQTSLSAQDMEGIMNIYSVDFTDFRGATRPMVRSMFEGMASQGTLQDITVEGLENSEITVADNSATVTPLIVVTPQGKLSYNCELKKEADGVWRIISAKQQ